MLSKVTGKPFIHRIGSDMDVDGRIARNFSKLSLAVYYYGLRNADHISCQNKYQYEILKNKYPSKSVSILYNSIEIKSPYNMNIEKEYIAWIGNFRYEKNLPALAEIAKNLPQYKFKIAGTRFSETDADAKHGLNELEKLENVEFVGHLNNKEITEFLSNFFCLLNTSRLEGFSNTFLEAWAAGIPVITTINVNPDNLITEYNLGITAEDYASMPKIIKELISTKKYLEFGKRCFEYVSEKHNPEKLAQQFLNDMLNCRK
ncbi:MAG: glycosyltransferase, partial [Ignavibacteriae bacterium]|nr:glycosyltransferase [Ignavibacteriota bacterium]